MKGGVQSHGGNGEFELEFDSDRFHIQEMAELVKKNALKAGIDFLFASRLKLIAYEVFSNIIEHAYQFEATRCIRLLAKTEGKVWALSIYDWGPPFDPLKLPDVNIRLDNLRNKETGRGIYIIRQLSQELHYERTSEGCNILIIKTVIPFQKDK